MYQEHYFSYLHLFGQKNIFNILFFKGFRWKQFYGSTTLETIYLEYLDLIQVEQEITMTSKWRERWKWWNHDWKVSFVVIFSSFLRYRNILFYLGILKFSFLPFLV